MFLASLIASFIGYGMRFSAKRYRIPWLMICGVMIEGTTWAAFLYMMKDQLWKG